MAFSITMRQAATARPTSSAGTRRCRVPVPISWSVKTFNKVTDAIEDAADNTRKAASDIQSKVKSGFNDAVNGGNDLFNDAKHEANKSANAVGNKIDKASSDAQRAAKNAQSKVETNADKADGQAANILEQGKQAVGDALDATKRTANQGKA